MISIFDFSLLSTKFFKTMDWFLYDRGTSVMKELEFFQKLIKLILGNCEEYRSRHLMFQRIYALIFRKYQMKTLFIEFLLKQVTSL